jgi:hypothetical protein
MLCQFCQREIADRSLICEWCGRRQEVPVEEPLPTRLLRVHTHLPQAPASITSAPDGKPTEPANAALEEMIAARNRLHPSMLMLAASLALAALALIDLTLFFSFPAQVPQESISWQGRDDPRNLRFMIDVIALAAGIALWCGPFIWRDIYRRRGLLIAFAASAVYDIFCLCVPSPFAPMGLISLVRGLVALYLTIDFYRLHNGLSVFVWDSSTIEPPHFPQF